MIANEKDNAVNFSQGIEFYLALRRFNKKVWMLSYPDAGHSIVDEKQALDYTNKVTDFLDFYLKNKQKPIWMLKKNE
jgi:dipeptidyl aminopeptidase/acylaminoacyl peptidase